MTAAHNSYLEGKVLGADPLTLVCILYSTAAQNVQIAIDTLGTGDAAARAQAVAKASNALGMLASALDLTAGGEVGQNLLRLYLYMQERLTASHAAKSKAGFQEIHGLLTTLQSGWTQVAAHPQTALPRAS
jgi:flagellar protein FliS